MFRGSFSLRKSACRCSARGRHSAVCGFSYLIKVELPDGRGVSRGAVQFRFRICTARALRFPSAFQDDPLPVGCNQSFG